MKGFREFLNIYLCLQPVDFRKGIYGLVNLIKHEIQEEPFSGTLFIFTNKNRKNIRAVYWDKTGFAMWCKALEKNQFPWPKNTQCTKIIIEHDQISLDSFWN